MIYFFSFYFEIIQNLEILESIFNIVFCLIQF